MPIYLTAQDLGVETLMKDGGIETLITTLKKMNFPLQSLEAKELFRVGQMQQGPLSRQTGESVTSFISRRRRWWRQVKELDSNMLISDQMRAELLIESAGLTKQEQLMIRTAAKNHTFDDYAAILLEHHGRIHLMKDSRPLAPQYKSSTNYPQKKGQSKGSQKPRYGNNRTAHWSEANEETWHDPEEYHGEDEHEETYDEQGYFAHNDESEQPTEWDYVEHDDTAAALVTMAECDHDETPAEGLDDLAEVAQQLYVGYMAAGTHKGKTKGFKGRDKGKGKGKHIFRTQLSVQDRVKRLAEPKARSKCLRCGSTGHWAGDPICKFPSQGKKPPVKPQASKPGVGYMAISDEESSAGEYGVLHVRSRQDQEKEHSAFMAYRTPASRRSAKAPPSAGGSADSGDFSMVSDTRKDRARRTRVPASAQGSESLPDGSDNKFTFGQHVGLSYHEVLHKYPGYYLWGK